MKKTLWKGTQNWDSLLSERAAISGELVLSDFTKKALSKFMGGSNNERELKRLNPMVDEINRFFEEYKDIIKS